MNKQLMVLAVASTLAVPLTASAADSTVTIFGRALMKTGHPGGCPVFLPPGTAQWLGNSVATQLDAQQLELAVKMSALQSGPLRHPGHIAAFLVNQPLKISFLE